MTTSTGAVVGDVAAEAPTSSTPVPGSRTASRTEVPDAGASAGSPRPRGGLLIAAGLLLTAVLVAGLLLRPDRRPSLETGENGQLVVRDGRRVLWEDDRFGGRRVVYARIAKGEGEVVVGVEPPPASDIDARPVLHFLDPRTGEPVAEPFEIASGSLVFTGYANVWTPTPKVVDLDDDGIDEILVTLAHVPNWPCYTVLYEPEHRRSRVAYASAGHHWFVDGQDLDGDDRAELLFHGLENAMGWHSSAAAVRLEPALDVSGLRAAQSWAPNHDFNVGRRNALLWFALLPPHSCGRDTECVDIDDGHGKIHFATDRAKSLVLDFDGFRADVSSPLPRAARIDARDRAWVALRAGDRALRAGDPEEALRELGNAQIAARQAGLPGLERTLRTREVAVLIRLGRETEEDLRIADDLTEGQRHQRLFDFAAAYHLAGRSEEAVTWYRRTLDASRTDIKVGRPRWELLRGLVLVLLELDRPGEAREAIATTRHALRVARWADDLEKVVRWRSGAGGLEPLLTADRLDDPAKADSIRYWSLEILVERGEQPPDRLLELVQADRRINSEARPLVMSLEAELLRTLGRTEEGDQLALEALARAQTMARTYPVVHSHLGLVRERAGAGTDGKADGRLEPTLAEATLPPIAPVVPDSPLTG